MSMALAVQVGEPLAHDPWFTEWLIEQGIDPTITFRVEIIDGEIVAHRYKLDENDKPFVFDAGKHPDEATHPEAGEIAIDEPLRIFLSAPLPDRILVEARRI